MKKLTVGELIAVLQTMPQDAEVCTEGCDCDGDVGEVENRPNLGDVYLKRAEY